MELKGACSDYSRMSFSDDSCLYLKQLSTVDKPSAFGRNLHFPPNQQVGNNNKHSELATPQNSIFT